MANDERNTKYPLAEELQEARRQIAQLEAARRRYTENKVKGVSI